MFEFSLQVSISESDALWLVRTSLIVKVSFHGGGVLSNELFSFLFLCLINLRI